MTDEQGHGLSRRDLIKRGAVIGGVVWAAPVVQGITSPAFANDGSPAGGECTDYFQFKADWNDKVSPPRFDFDLDQDANLPFCEGKEPAGWGDYEDGSDRIVLTPILVDEKLVGVTVSDNPAAPDCEVLILTIKGGAEGVNAGGYCTTAKIAPDSSSATVTATDGASAISYIAGIICCEPPTP